MTLITLYKNVYLSLSVTLTLFIILGFWAKTEKIGIKKCLHYARAFMAFMFIVGIYILAEIADLFDIWGDIGLMMGSTFLLLTNLACAGKVCNLVVNQKKIESMIIEVNEELASESREEGLKIIKSCNRETSIQLFIYLGLSYLGILGWAAGSGKRQLLTRAKYPYDSTKSPAYELTYVHQSVIGVIGASMDICIDSLATSLINQCCCRMQLLALSLSTLCEDVPINDRGVLTAEGEKIVINRLHQCIQRHQAALRQVDQLQEYFSVTVFGQLAVSIIIICATGYQLIFESSLIRILSMIIYLVDMVLQVYIYCQQGNSLLDQSDNIKDAAYSCEWYTCSTRVRRELLILFSRTQRESRILAGGITELSMENFMALIKTSYSVFTLLQQVGEN